MMVEKIVPSEEELKPTTENAVKKNRKKHLVKKGTVNQFHCPVNGCVYGSGGTTTMTPERHFSCIKYLKQHYRKVHAEKIFSCVRCEMKFAILSDHRAHDAVCGQQFECSCGTVFNKRESLLTHAHRKRHELPSKQRLKRKPNNSSVTKNTSSVSMETTTTEVPTNPTVVVVFDGISSSSNTRTAVLRKPCLILPKPAPLSTVPLQTVAAMALSELSNYQCLNTKRTVTTQTEGIGNCTCRAVKHDTKRSAKRSSETQTLTRNKRQRRDLTSCSTQTKQNVAPLSKETPQQTETTRTEPFPTQSYDYHLQQHRNHEYLWQIPDDGSLTMTDKLCRTINDLDIDVNFQLVSSGTQTSPRIVPKKNPICDRFLDSPLRNYLALENLTDYPLQLSSVCGGSEEVETVRQQLSSIETQTEVDFEALLDGCGVEIPSNEADIQTQTSEEDLESIPYDQLLSHMETQTSDLFFTELGNLCNIQTQTVYDYGSIHSGSVHTQTTRTNRSNPSSSLRNGGHGSATAQLTNMETQTFLSFLEMVETPSPIS